MPKRVPAEVVLDDVHERRQEMLDAASRSPVYVDVPVDRVEEPQRGVGRVVEPLALALGEQIGDEPVLHVASEGAQDRLGLGSAGPSPA